MLRKIENDQRPTSHRVGVREIIRDGFPRFGIGNVANRWRARNFHRLIAPMVKVAIANALRLSVITPTLRLTLIRDGQIIPLGMASMKLVTTAGVNFIVDAFQNSVEVENLKYHGYGTGTTAESAAHTALVTELTTEYATDNTRPTGTTTEGASANIYRTVATLSPNAGGTIAVTEHGIFDQAANSGGVMLDRSVFSAVNLVASADSLQTTYELTFPSGG